MGVVSNVFWEKATNSGFFVVVVKTDTMDDKGGQKSEGKPKTEMDKEAAARIQSAEAKKNDGKVEKGGFAARAQSAADKNEAAKDEEGKWAWITSQITSPDDITINN